MSKMNHLPDQELTHLLKNGDHKAFTEIYNRYWQVLYLHSFKMLRDQNEAMDVVQELFSVIWKRREELYFNTSLKSYLYTSIRNQTLKVIYKGKLHDGFVRSIAMHLQAGVNVTDETLSFNEFSALLEKEVRELSPRMQLIFNLSRNEGLSHKEIAQRLGITEHTVKITIHRALNILRGKILLTISSIIASYLSK